MRYFLTLHLISAVSTATFSLQIVLFYLGLLLTHFSASNNKDIRPHVFYNKSREIQRKTPE